ncbi:hypothetical protein BH10PSE17_BH10PSE17_08680 [soil metagenome]
MNKETVLNQLTGLVQQIETLAHEAIDGSDSKLARARARLMEAERAALVKGREALTYGDETIRSNPYAAIGVAAIVGLLAGVLIARDRD